MAFIGTEFQEVPHFALAWRHCFISPGLLPIPKKLKRKVAKQEAMVMVSAIGQREKEPFIEMLKKEKSEARQRPAPRFTTLLWTH